MSEIEHVQRAEEPAARAGELQKQELPAWPHHAQHLSQRPFSVRHVPEAERHAAQRRGVVRARHGQRIARRKEQRAGHRHIPCAHTEAGGAFSPAARNRRALRTDSPPCRLPQRQREHFRREIQAHDPRLRRRTVQRKRQIASAGAEIHKHIAGAQPLRFPRRSLAPPGIATQRKEVIEEVVTPRHAGEHGTHFRRCLAPSVFAFHRQQVTISPAVCQIGGPHGGAATTMTDLPQIGQACATEVPSVAPELQFIRGKVLDDARLTRDDGLLLFQTRDLLGLGALARYCARRKHGSRIFYVVNGHINYSNHCILGCLFCSFYRRKGADERPGGYELSLDQIVQRAGEIAASGATEVHCVGGLHPGFPFGYYLDMLSEIRRRHPRIGLKFFSASEVLHLSRLAKLSPRETLAALREAGLDTLPGGGAEILDDGLRRVLCPGKEAAAAWLGLHRTAHQLGIRSNATMLYGHLETPAQRLEHLLRLRELQDETGGFLAFVPLSYHPANNALRVEHGPSALDELRTHAVARLLLDNFPHVKAYWVTLSVPVAQIALTYGATDFDGTVLREQVQHMAGAGAPQALAVKDLQRLIREAGGEPAERDHLYRRVVRGSAGPLDWRTE